MSQLKITPLHAEHLALGAKMMPFAGYDMPVRYAGDQAEHIAVREQAGLFDVSHMGEFLVRGPGALSFLQSITTNDISKVPVGKAQYNCLPNATGGIVDDLIIYHLEKELYMAVVNASNIEKDWDWFVQHNTTGVQLEDISDKTALLSLSGPKAVEILRKLSADKFEEIPYYGQLYGTVAGIEKVLIATTGYTGERTFELYVRSESAVKLWKAILEAGAEFGIQPIGLGARDTLRLEMGYMLYGNDITDHTSPLEAGLGWIVKLKKGPFIASDEMEVIKEGGPKHMLVAFVLEDKGICRSHCELAVDGQMVGEVTSGGFSPTLKQSIGLGYVPIKYAAEGTEIQVVVREKQLKARVTKAPFLKDTSLSRWQATLKA